MSLTSFEFSERGVWMTVLTRVAENLEGTLTANKRRSSRICGITAAPAVSTPAVCVAAVLSDPLRRVALLGGRKRKPRSLGSVYGGLVALFLRGAFRGHCLARYGYVGPVPEYTCVTLAHDGATLLATSELDSNLFELDLAGQQLRALGNGRGEGEKQFECPNQVSVAPDGFVYIAEMDNCRVQVWTPEYDFSAFLDIGTLAGWPRAAPRGVVANATTVFVSVDISGGRMYGACRILVIDRVTGMVTHTLSGGNSEGFCFLPKSGLLAVIESTGVIEMITVQDPARLKKRDIPFGDTGAAKFVYSTPHDELVLVSYQRRQRGFIHVFNASGKLHRVWEFPRGLHAAVLLNHRRSVLVFSRDGIEEFV